LTDEFEINPKVLMKLKDMVQAGATIIGPKPKKIAQRKIQPDMPDMGGWLDNFWKPFNSQNFKAGAPLIYTDVEVQEMLDMMEIKPDLEYQDMDFYPLDYIHYQKEGLDFYFVVNTTDTWLSRNIGFRQQEKSPEI